MSQTLTFKGSCHCLVSLFHRNKYVAKGCQYPPRQSPLPSLSSNELFLTVEDIKGPMQQEHTEAAMGQQQRSMAARFNLKREVGTYWSANGIGRSENEREMRSLQRSQHAAPCKACWTIHYSWLGKTSMMTRCASSTSIFCRASPPCDSTSWTFTSGSHHSVGDSMLPNCWWNVRMFIQRRSSQGVAPFSTSIL